MYNVHLSFIVLSLKIPEILGHLTFLEAIRLAISLKYLELWNGLSDWPVLFLRKLQTSLAVSLEINKKGNSKFTGKIIKSLNGKIGEGKKQKVVYGQ